MLQKLKWNKIEIKYLIFQGVRAEIFKQIPGNVRNEAIVGRCAAAWEGAGGRPFPGLGCCLRT
jgi:hypothetical protein